jgi:hypothetical protein
MKLAEMNWSPTDRQLRQFAVVALMALPLAGWMWGARGTTFVWLMGAGLAVGTVGGIAPRLVKPLFIGLSLVALPLGMVCGELALLVVFFGVFLPLSLAFRLAKRDALQRSIDRTLDSYWQRKTPPRGPASYYRQF